MSEDVKRIVTALRFCAEHLYSCEGCPEAEVDGNCMSWRILLRAADALEHLSAELEEEKRKAG